MLWFSLSLLCDDDPNPAQTLDLFLLMHEIFPVRNVIDEASFVPICGLLPHCPRGSHQLSPTCLDSMSCESNALCCFQPLEDGR